jgi:hypothetical protein
MVTGITMKHEQSIAGKHPTLCSPMKPLWRQSTSGKQRVLQETWQQRVVQEKRQFLRRHT